MAIRRKDFQKLVGLVKEFLSKLPSNEVTAELRDALHLSLLHMHRYYKRIRLQAHSAATVALETSLSLFHHWNGSMSPVSPHMPPTEKFDWRWMSLDASKLSASFGHSDFGNIVPEIFYVIKEGNVQELKRMINQEPDLVHETDALGRTTAMYAVHGNTLEHLKCLQALKENGVDFNAQANDGSTSLHIAAHSRNIDMLQEIIKQKVNVNAEDHDGHTALHWASMYPESSMVKVLLSHGASCSSEDRDGLTPPMWACYFDHVDNLDFQLSGIRKEFPSFDVVANMRDKKSKSIIHWAVSRPGNSECIKYLLTPQNAVLKEKDGKSVFLVAAEHGCVAGCEEILALCGTGVVDEVDNLGRTALHLASLNGHGEVIDLLLNKGASQYAKDAKGMTPLDYIKCRQLNYCSLVFLSYKAYDEKIHNSCISNIDGIVGEKNIERMCPLEGNKRENTHTVSEQKQPVASTTYDIWRADVDEVEGFETQREDFVESTPLKANDNALKLLRSASKHKTGEGTHEFTAADLDLPETVDEEKKVSHTDMHDIMEDLPASPHITDTDACERISYETENNNYTITANNKRDVNVEPLDFDLDDQVLVLVEHPGSDDEQVVFRYGNEFLENETVTECPAEVDAEVDSRLRVDVDHDLLDISHTPRLPTVTATSEPSAAVVSASVNLSVPSFGSDSESEDLDKNHTETNAAKDEGSFVAEHKLDSGDTQVKEDVPVEEQPSLELSTNHSKNDQDQGSPPKEDQAPERKNLDTKRSSHIPIPATRGGVLHSSSSGFSRERPGSSGLLLSLPVSPRASSLGSLEPLTLVQPVSPLGKTSPQKAPYVHHMGRSNSTENLDWRGRAVPAGNTRVNRRNSAGSLIPRPASPRERPQSAPGSNSSYIPKPPLSR